MELQPKFFDGKEEIWRYVRDFSKTSCKKGGIQINLNIMDLEKLRDAMDHHENPAYQNIIVRVTGYASRFICLSRVYQKEFVERLNYDEIYRWKKSGGCRWVRSMPVLRFRLTNKWFYSTLRTMSLLRWRCYLQASVPVWTRYCLGLSYFCNL